MLALLVPIPFFAPQPIPQPMHIPDGFLSLLVCAALWLVSALVLAVGLRKTNQLIGERQVPLMGVTAAAVFAGQMLNFSVAGGTSGHLLGAAMATILLGPWPAVLTMTTVVAVQALLFQDGGLLALGANIFNMAIVGVFVSYALYAPLAILCRRQTWGLPVAGAVAAWASIFVTALAVSLQLAFSGTSPANIAIPAMGGIHALIGIGEGLITAGALGFILAARRDLLVSAPAERTHDRSILFAGGLIVLALALLSPFASTQPDGLEWVAGEYGFLSAAREALFRVIPDYALPGISDPALATVAAAILGASIVFSIAYGIARAGKQPTG